MIQNDIIERLQNDFRPFEIEEIMRILQGLSERDLNIELNQLARSLIFLAKGDLQNLKSKVSSISIEPRGILLEAEAVAGNPEHYFKIPFPEIDSFFEQLYGEEIEPPLDIWIE